jgi:hypothetical protein
MRFYFVEVVLLLIKVEPVKLQNLQEIIERLQALFQELPCLVRYLPNCVEELDIAVYSEAFALNNL